MKLPNDKGDRLSRRAYNRFRLHQRSSEYTNYFLIEAIIPAVREYLFKKKVKNQTMVILDASTNSADGKVIRCNFKPGSVERSFDD
jgi:hypothetical protein